MGGGRAAAGSAVSPERERVPTEGDYVSTVCTKYLKVSRYVPYEYDSRESFFGRRLSSLLSLRFISRIADVVVRLRLCVPTVQN